MAKHAHTSHGGSHHGSSHHGGVGPGVLLLPFLVLGVWAYLRMRSSGGVWRASKGPTTISDYGDGLAAFGGATLLALFGLFQGGLLVVGGVYSLLENPGAALVALAIGVGVLYVTWYLYSRRLRVMRVAKPGEIVVPHWPLREGECVKVAYGRALKPECRLRQMFAELQLFETCKHYDYHKRRNVTEVRLIERIDLGTGGGRQTDEGLHAIFDVDVPHPDGSCPRTGFAAFWAKLGFGAKRQWRLRVHLAVDGLPDDDSQFILAIAEAHAGEAVAPRRRGSRAA